MKPVVKVIIGGLAAGLLDITYAIAAWAIRSHVPPIRIGQGIASHVLGTSSFDGGWSSATLGFGLHFAIMMVMALTYYILCQVLPVVARRPLAFAPVYGIGLWLVMVYGVLPMTNPAPKPYPAFPPEMGFDFASAMFAHIILVALPIAFAAKRALAGKA